MNAAAAPSLIPAALRPLAGRALEIALNRLLGLDPASVAALAPLAGQRIDLQLEAPALALRISVDGDRLKVGAVDPADEPELSLRASAGALLGRLLPGRDSAPPVGKLRISGDAELAQRLQQLVTRFEPDFEAAFAGVFGDVLGVQLARALRAGLLRGREEAARFSRDVADYLVEERRDVVSRAEQAGFFEQVDDLRDAVERLEVRVRRLGGGRR